MRSIRRFNRRVRSKVKTVIQLEPRASRLFFLLMRYNSPVQHFYARREFANDISPRERMSAKSIIGATLKRHLPMSALTICVCISNSVSLVHPITLRVRVLNRFAALSPTMLDFSAACCTAWRMGSITVRKRKDGTPSHLAQIIIKRGGSIVHRENKTFASKHDAAFWIAQRERELSQPNGLIPTENPKLADVIERFTNESRAPVRKTKAQALRFIRTTPLGAMKCADIESRHLVSFARELSDGRTPATVANYLSHLSAVFAIAKPAWGYPLNPQAALDALKVTRRLGLTGKSKRRERRPTIAELDMLLAYFDAVRARRRDSVPMADIVLFALFSSRRLEEITRIEWRDYEPEHRRIMVRDMKNPEGSAGNDVLCDVPPEAARIIERQPRRSERIFPANADTVSTAFTRACAFLGIDDLHFHDLRHDAVSRLFELGNTIPHVAAVSGHRSWNSLKRYTHIKQRGDKYAGWERANK